ncbi:hypothetical protein D5S17_35835 [Pseudonocardiaceae bacterium YIM PH 21723]|nr:hypothetical protein D5S17_35835 [Pseudonocardiaceae bacterium YIM PH 21723]
MGTSTCARVLHMNSLGAITTQDQGIYVGGPVDVLVTDNTASAIAWLGRALADCPRPPLLVVMHRAPDVESVVRAELRKLDRPTIAGQIDIKYQETWLELTAPPGRHLPWSPRAAEALNAKLAKALDWMWDQPVKQPPAPEPPPVQQWAPVPTSSPLTSRATPLSPQPSVAVPRAGPGAMPWVPAPGAGQQGGYRHTGQGG